MKNKSKINAKTKPWIVGTGFSRGIGLELAKKIKELDYKILHIGRKPCGFEDEFINCNLSSPPSSTFFKSFRSKIKNKNIVGFLYSAGLFPSLVYKNNSKSKMEFWKSQTDTMQVNYLSCAALIEEIVPYLLNSAQNNLSRNPPDKAQEVSHIPFIAHLSSLAAVDPLPAFEFYGITKLATLKHFEDFAKRFKLSTEPKLYSFSIHPGTVYTDMIKGIMNPTVHKHLPVVQMFQSAISENKLISAEQSAHLIVDFLFHKNYAALRNSAHGKLYLADIKKLYTNTQ